MAKRFKQESNAQGVPYRKVPYRKVPYRKAREEFVKLNEAEPCYRYTGVPETTNTTDQKTMLLNAFEPC
jgi:hypothetical protein